jgi:hypothetical protein
MHKRERAQFEALLGTALPAALLSIAAAAMVLYGVRRGLAPPRAPARGDPGALLP